MKPIASFICAFIFFFGHISADNSPKKKALELSLSLRQSVLDKNTIAKPALIQFILPSDPTKDNSYAIDGGLALLFSFNSPAWQYAATLEYHRQTEILKPQDNFQAGLSVINILGDVTEGLSLYSSVSAKYKHDKIVSGDGMLIKLDTTPLLPRIGMGATRGIKQLQVLWQPTVGVQYETASNVLKTGKSGKVVRALFNIEIGLYPFSRILKNSLELVLRNSSWINLNRTGEYKKQYDSYQNMFKAGISYYIDKNHHFGIGVDYFKGENPEQGLLNQEATLFSLKIKY
jgi:hypothetical protein